MLVSLQQHEVKPRTVNIDTKVNKNLIAISIVSTLLILWLATTFWFNAYSQRNDAAWLRSSITPETQLSELADSLDAERSMLHRLYEHSQLDEAALASYRRQGAASGQFLHTVVQNEILLQSDSADQHIRRLTDSYEALAGYRSALKLQAGEDLTALNDAGRMQFFEVYTDLIKQVSDLRSSALELSGNNHYNAAGGKTLMNVLWSLRESVMQINAILTAAVDRYPVYSQADIDRNGLVLRLQQQQLHALHAVRDLNQLFTGSPGFAPPTNLNDAYHQFFDIVWPAYQSTQAQLIERLALTGDYADLKSSWEGARNDLRQSIQALIEGAGTHTLETAQTFERNTNRRLIADTALVLLCIGMAVLSSGIARKVQHQANHDDLTQLPNRRFFNEQADVAIENAAACGSQLALLTIDLNRFKSINDSLGHAIGDALLIKVAERLRGCVDNRMCLARLGGDEFSILFEPGNDFEPLRLASRIVNALDADFLIGDGSVHIGTSIGISLYPRDADTAARLKVNADYAMFFAKREGQNNRKSCVESFKPEMAEEFENRLRIERDLAVALEGQQLELYYQPQFNLLKNRVDAVEALVRWNHPQRGLIPPSEFITIAEECGLMPALGRWVLNEACRQAACWLKETSFGLRVAINVSVHQIMQPDFVEQVIATLERHELDANAIEIELTESVFMSDSDWVIQSLVKLREAGIKIALDDFGTGYSSLSQLQNLPVSSLKIDRSFISRLNTQPSVSHSVTATIASIADVLGLETVAEGVESDLQHDQVADLGINVVQGFFYSRPMASGKVPQAIVELNNMHGDLQSAA